MNYYIQGDAANADKIKAEFKELGYNTRGLNFSDGFFYTVERDVHYCIYDYMVNIIKTHPDYKELELPIEPKFKVGDRVIYGGKERTITFMDDHFYDFDGGCAGCRIELQDELLRPAPKSHYDVSNFHAGMPVLVRDTDKPNERWQYVHFSHYYGRSFYACGCTWDECIPFNDDTKHLLGTTDMCDEQYINW